MKRRTTISDIARELNLTPATVSRSLNNHPAISEKTKKLINETAIKLKYKRNEIATSLKSGRSKLIGVIIPSAEINFFGSVVHGIENMASKNGYNVLLYQSNESRENEAKAVDTFLRTRVDGILVSLAKETSDFSHFQEIKERGVPIVFFDRTQDALGMPSVVVDDRKGGFLATEHLIQQGYQRIAHINGHQQLSVFKNRQEGYLDALQKYQLPVDEKLIYPGKISIQSGKEAVQHFLKSNHPPDAIFAVEDFTALGAIKALKENGIRIPQDFGIVGFADELFGEHITPSLTTFNQKTVEMGEASFELLLNIIDKKKVKQPRIILDPKMIIRGSSVKIF